MVIQKFQKPIIFIGENDMKHEKLSSRSRSGKNSPRKPPKPIGNPRKFKHTFLSRISLALLVQ
jgi:hypothetical protein